MSRTVALLTALTAAYAQTPFATTVKPALVPFEIPANRGAAALWQSLQKLHTRASMIMITAHPDDEDGATLAYESRHLGATVTLLTLNRGEGGANVMSADYWDALGLVRTQELLAAGSYYGVDQYFTRVCDYGFSKTMDEALSKWKHDSVLADVVRVVRMTRPLIVTSVFVGGSSDGHGNHQVAGRMAKEAFEAVGDPNRFPEQIREGLRPWKPLKYYARTPFRGGNLSKTLDAPVGDYDPLLGESFLQLSRQGLGSQKSQNGGTGMPAAGPLPSPYHRYASLVPAKDQEQSFFDGIDASLVAIGPPTGFVHEGLLKINTSVEESIAQFSAVSPEKSAPALAQGLKATESLLAQVQSSSLPEEIRYGVLHELKIKQTQFNNALVESLGISLKATVLPDHEVNPLFALFMGDPDTFQMAIPGQRFRVGVNVANQSSAPLKIARVYLDSPYHAAWDDISQPKQSANGQWQFDVTASESTPFTRPYFTRPSIEQPYYDLANPALLSQPGAPYPLNAWAEISYNGVSLKLGQVVQTTHRETGPGVVYQPLTVGPAISVQLSPRAGVVPLSAKNFNLAVTIHSNVKGPAEGTVALQLPPGWKSDPPQQAFTTAKDGDDQALQFNVIPGSLREQPYEITALAKFNGHEYREGYQVVGYQGLRPSFLYQPATYKTAGVNVTVAPDLKVAYIMGSGDDVPAALEQLGVKVTFLTASDLASGDLGRFDLILLGVRAYAARPDLIKNNQRLLDYVNNGGVAIVQYNTPEFDHNYGPYPYKMGNDPEEVTDEDSQVTLLAPDNPVFAWPNKISAADFQGWIEERGSKFLTTWDTHYQALLETHDPGQPPQKGGLLFARYGKGIYVYNAYAFYRELPEGVPGAFRLMANLLSLPKNPSRSAQNDGDQLQKALALARQHQFAEADSLLAGVATPEDKTNAVAFFRLRAAVDSGLKRPAAAAADMHHALDLAPDQPNLKRATALADLAAGDAYEASGDSVKAAASYQQAVELDSTQEQYRLSLAVEFMQHHTFKPAAEVLERAAADFPHSPRVATALGLAYYLEDNQPNAAAALLRAISLDNNFSPPRIYLSQISLARSDAPDPATINALCAYADQNPIDAHANAVCGALRLKVQEAPDDLTLQRLAVASQGAPRDALARCEYAKALAQVNQLVKARTEFESCLALDPDSVEAHFRLSRVYRQLGFADLAKQQADLRAAAEQHQSAANEQRYRTATAFLFNLRKPD